jgi:hypothetical protein
MPDSMNQMPKEEKTIFVFRKTNDFILLTMYQET